MTRTIPMLTVLLLLSVLVFAQAHAGPVRIADFTFGCATPAGQKLKPQFGDMDGIYYTEIDGNEDACIMAVKSRIATCHQHTRFLLPSDNEKYSGCLPIFEQQARACVAHFQRELPKCGTGAESSPRDSGHAGLLQHGNSAPPEDTGASDDRPVANTDEPWASEGRYPEDRWDTAEDQWKDRGNDRWDGRPAETSSVWDAETEADNSTEWKQGRSQGFQRDEDETDDSGYSAALQALGKPDGAGGGTASDDGYESKLADLERREADRKKQLEIEAWYREKEREKERRAEANKEKLRKKAEAKEAERTRKELQLGSRAAKSWNRQSGSTPSGTTLFGGSSSKALMDRNRKIIALQSHLNEAMARCNKIRPNDRRLYWNPRDGRQAERAAARRQRAEESARLQRSRCVARARSSYQDAFRYLLMRNP